MAMEDIIARLGMDSSGFSRGISAVQNKLTGLSSDIRKIGGFIAASFAVKAVKDVIAFGSAITDASEATRVNMITLQALDHAARMAGAGQETMHKALQKVQISAQEASNGSKTYVRALETLSINTRKFASMSPEYQLQEIGRAYMESGESQQAFAAVMALIGEKNGPKLLEVLKQIGGKDGLDGITKSAMEAGVVLSTLDAMRLDRLGDTLDTVGVKLKVLTARLLNAATGPGGPNMALANWIADSYTEEAVALGHVANETKKAADAREELNRIEAQGIKDTDALVAAAIVQAKLRASVEELPIKKQIFWYEAQIRNLQRDAWDRNKTEEERLKIVGEIEKKEQALQKLRERAAREETEQVKRQRELAQIAQELKQRMEDRLGGTVESFASGRTTRNTSLGSAARKILRDEETARRYYERAARAESRGDASEAMEYRQRAESLDASAGRRRNALPGLKPGERQDADLDRKLRSAQLDFYEREKNAGIKVKDLSSA